MSELTLDPGTLRTVGYHAPDDDLSLPYFDHEFSGIGEKIKQEQRERIVRFILDNHSPEDFKNMKFFGFPGAEWKFENMLEYGWTVTKPRFVGIERSSQVMEYAVRHMPGSSEGKIKFGVSNSQKYWPLANGGIYGWRNPRSRYLNFHAEHFWTLNNTDKGAVKCFEEKFLDWTCAWIDPFCQLHGKFFEALHRVPSLFKKQAIACPIAISFAIGHDRFASNDHEDAIDSRTRAVERIMAHNWHRDFRVVDTFAYKRATRSITMGTVLGILTLKKKNDVV